MSTIAAEVETPYQLPQQKRYLVSPVIDTLMTGGISIVFFAICWFFLRNDSPTAITAFYYLSFIVNFPHFLVSYQLLYGDAGYLIFKKFRFFWAAVLSPILLLAGMLICAAAMPQSIGYFANLLFLLVGWHYVKQIFGGIIVTSVLQKKFYNRNERLALQINLYAVWMVSWISSNVGMHDWFYYGISYKSLNFPSFFQTCAYVFLAISLSAVLVTQFLKYYRDKVLPPLSAIACFVSIYIWFLPALYNPVFFLGVPLLHSMQYFLFVYAFRRNKVRSEVANLSPQEIKKAYRIKLYGYLLLPIITGALAFIFIPNFIDRHTVMQSAYLGPTFAAFLFTIFINIHHYFIDNVIWKGNNPQMQQYLFK